MRRLRRKDGPPPGRHGARYDAGTGTPDATTVVEVDGATCLDITVTNADLSCAIDDECALANTGVICTPGCGCPGGTAVNSAAATRISAEIRTRRSPR